MSSLATVYDVLMICFNVQVCVREDEMIRANGFLQRFKHHAEKT